MTDDELRTTINAAFLQLLSDGADRALYYSDTLKPPPQWWSDIVHKHIEAALAKTKEHGIKL